MVGMLFVTGGVDVTVEFDDVAGLETASTMGLVVEAVALVPVETGVVVASIVLDEILFEHPTWEASNARLIINKPAALTNISPPPVSKN
jgi:hypothetical protein